MVGHSQEGSGTITIGFHDAENSAFNTEKSIKKISRAVAETREAIRKKRTNEGSVALNHLRNGGRGSSEVANKKDTLGGFAEDGHDMHIPFQITGEKDAQVSSVVHKRFNMSSSPISR